MPWERVADILGPSRTPGGPQRPRPVVARLSAIDLDSTTLRAQRHVVAAVAALSPLVLWTSAADPVSLPKWTFIVAGAAVVGALGAARVASTRRFEAADIGFVLLAAVFAAALVAATVTSPAPLLSLYGEYREYSGLLGHLSYVTLGLVTLGLTAALGARWLVRAVLVGAAGVTLYGLVQLAGLDPLDWETYGFGGVAATLGNSNVAAGYLGLTLPLALWAALDAATSVAWRAAAATLFLAGLVVVVGTGSFQGPVTVAVGSTVVAAAWLAARRDLLRRRRRAVAGGAVAVAGLAALVGPRVATAVVSGVDSGLEERLLIWQAALVMLADHPVLGSGLDTFGMNFLAYRPTEHAARYGVVIADAAHNVPLGMFATGGVVLGAAYLAVVGYVAWALLLGYRRADADRRWLLAGLGAAWTGYQVQSLVSFDRPPLAVVHWLLAGAIVATARVMEGRSWTLPGAPRRRGKRRRGRPAPLPTSTRAACAVIAVGALAVVWFAGRPLRADVAAARGVVLVRGGQVEPGLAALDRATQLAPYRGTYFYFWAAILERLGDPGAALAAAEQAATTDAGNAEFALYAAGLAARVGNAEAVETWARSAVDRDPRSAVTLEKAASLLESHGRDAAALDLRRRATALHAGSEGAMSARMPRSAIRMPGG